MARDGKLLAPRCLGVEADVSDEILLESGSLAFSQPIAVSSDGIDVQIIGTNETQLIVEFAPVDKPEATKQIELALADFAAASPFVLDASLDDRGNSVKVQRVPGDRLRVEFERSSLVFSPGEAFSFQVRPHELGLPAGMTLRCTLQVHPVDTTEVTWKEQRELRIDPHGQIPAVGPVTLTMPDEEGVYDLVVSLVQRRFTDSLVPGNLVPAKPFLQRKVQFVVLDDRYEPAKVADWELVEEIDPGNPKWWERMNWLPQWKVLPGRVPRGPLGDRPLQPRESLTQKLYELGPNGWHAAPVPIAELGRPHILEVEYPTDQRQTLSIGVVEPNAAGEVQATSLDSGVDVPGYPRSATGQLAKHRLIFWPRTKTPWLLLTNRREDGSAAFGRIRIFAGPAELPPMELRSASSERLLVACYEKPLFAENFGAAESLDIVTGRSHKDWQTFYLGGLRLIEYLKHAGYNSAVIPVLSEGGSLFPCRSLTTTPRYDNGTMFQSGQDPISKDVLEMLLQLFDRAGLKLFPSLQFNSQLPSLEEELQVSRTDLGGIAMVGFLPADPRPRLGRADSRLGAAPFYNPLDRRVQAAMRKVAAEVLERCASHPSFAGLAVPLSPYGYAVLPDESWCLDDVTFSRFAQATRRANPTGLNRLDQRLQQIRGPAREAWLQWRAAELTRFYGELSSDVRSIKADAKLILTASDLVNGRVVQNSLRPRLPARGDFADALLRHGLDANALAQGAATLLLRPRRTTVSTHLADVAPQLELAQSDLVNDYFRQADQTGALAVTEPLLWRLPEFDAVSPFGSQNTATAFAAHILPTGDHRRAAFAHFLSTFDSALIADGGWMLPLGQEESQNRFARVYRQLPAAKFTTVRPLSATSPTQGTNSSQVVVRSLQQAGQTYFYVVNPNSLPAAVQIEMEVATPCTAESLDDRPAPVFPMSGGRATWKLNLEPYDVAAIRCSVGDAQVRGWSVKIGEENLAELTSMVQQLRVRVDQLDKFQAVGVISNADFEQPAEAGQVPGWRFARVPGVTVDVDTNLPFQGRQSLHFKVTESKTAGWILSEPFPMPRTGRVSVQAWIRTRDGDRQPPLRMSIDGQLANGQLYQRWSALGVDVDGRTLLPSGRKAEAVPAKWAQSPFLLHITDLPPSSTSEISVRFDLLGPGEVWIDDIQISDVYFELRERNELLKNVFNAHFQLQQGALGECQRFLQGFWPRFVLEYVAPSRLAHASAPTPRAPGPESSRQAEPVEKSTKWRILPKIPLKSPFK